MGDVELAVHEPLSRGPPESMPDKVEKANRDTPVDLSGTSQLWIVGEPIPGRTREDGDIKRLNCRTTGAGQQGTNELMCVFADTAAVLERRPVVYDNAHLFKSFRLSILLLNENRCRRYRLCRSRRGRMSG